MMTNATREQLDAKAARMLNGATFDSLTPAEKQYVLSSIHPAPLAPTGRVFVISGVQIREAR